MIEVKHLTKLYGKKTAVNDVSFTVEEGAVVGFLGRNGAGKTTTMNMITGYISATEGSVSVNGYDVLQKPLQAKRQIGYLPEHPPLYLDLTVSEYLQFACELKGIKTAERKQHMARIMELVKIADMGGRLVGNLSKGYRQRVGLAQALVGNPPVLILDEPTVGLDPRQIIEIRRLIKDLGKKHTVILSSHILPEVADICEKVIIIDEGRVVAEDTLENLRHGTQESRLSLRVAGPEAPVVRLCKELPGVQAAQSMGVRETGTVDVLLTLQKGADVRRQLFSALGKAGFPLLLSRYMDVTLEDVFLQLTGMPKGEM